MTQIIVDAALRDKLNGLDKPIDFVDESGKRLGRYVPDDAARFVPPPEDQCPYTPEELEQFEREGGEHTLADIWKELGVS
jgi:hypothetical protein